ncbi:MAG: penicillin-binding protein 2 [Thermoanaerobaculaceae bacterium]|jgi:cell division protein FtsI/penicillin-binding protein 2|nr:penicillin-binding protein 2 [Thermoanaerobaculaceae bacterium]
MISRARFRLVAWVLAAWAALVWGRLAQVQVLDHQTWSEEAIRQREKAIEVEKPRGEIQTRDGRLLAGSLERRAVYANPRQIPSKAWPELAARLAPLTGHTAADVIRELGEHDGFFYLAKDLDPEVEASVSRLRQRGVGTIRTERRVYPHGTLAGPLIGFVDGAGTGKAGLESYYDRTLAGEPAVYRALRDGKSFPTRLDLRLERSGRPGQSLLLSIDSRVQQVVEDELARTILEIGAESASAVVMDAFTGELLALASLPSYDPARAGETTPQQQRNHAVQDMLEPGSTFKPIIVCAALTHGVLKPWDMVDCSGGGIQIAGVFMRDHASYGALSVRDMLAKSSNSGTMRVALRLSPVQLDGFIRALGFGRATGIGLPGEMRGLYQGPDTWSALSRPALSIGQEIAVTPLQLARAYAAIANGGSLVQPVLVLETRDAEGRQVTPFRPTPAARVMPEEVARTVASMLEAVIDEGTGARARLAGYRLAGKTGTAQKAAGGGYKAGLHAAWFAGYLQLPDPRHVIVVCVDEPKATYWATDVAAPAFGRIAARLVTLLGVPPNKVQHT